MTLLMQMIRNGRKNRRKNKMFLIKLFLLFVFFAGCITQRRVFPPLNMPKTKQINVCVNCQKNNQKEKIKSTECDVEFKKGEYKCHNVRLKEINKKHILTCFDELNWPIIQTYAEYLQMEAMR